MAAITAAICLGDDVHPDRNRRWQVGLVYAAIWVGLGLLGPLILSLLAFSAVTRLPEEELLSWGWRVPSTTWQTEPARTP